jgi:hypothetical protein
MMSKNEDEKKVYAHIKCFNVEIRDTLSRSVLPSLRKRLKQLMRGKAMESNTSKEEKAQSKRKCCSCRERGHMANSHPLGNTPKPISIDANIMLRKNGNGTSLVAIAKNIPLHILRHCLSMLHIT